MHISHKTYKAAIFDLDGTLLNTIEDIAESCNSALKKEGFPGHPVSAYKGFVGMGLRHLVNLILPGDRITDEMIEVVLKQVLVEYSKHLTRKTKPYPGIVHVLSHLCEKGIKVSILSNKPQKMVEQLAETLLRQFPFHIIMGTNDRFPQKPDPGSTFYILNEMGESASTTVFIGDSEVDIRTARNAGLDCIGAGWGFRDPAILQSEGAHLIIGKPGDLLRFF